MSNIIHHIFNYNNVKFTLILISLLIIKIICDKYISPDKFSDIFSDSALTGNMMNGNNYENNYKYVEIDIPDLPSPNITHKLCPVYGINIKGFLCLGWNSIKITKANSWQECASFCSDYVSFFFIKCKQWSYDIEKKKCLIKTGDKVCKYPDENYVSGVVSTSEVGMCSTTCKVGDWSSWTPCTSYCAGITQRVRHVIKSPLYKSELCPRLVETAMCKGSVDCPRNCPNYHVVGLGWGCKVEINKGGGTMRKYVNTWHECLGLCKNTENCTYWSFQGISGVETCLLVIGEVGCTYHALGWVSGDVNVVAVDCPVKCYVGEWSEWSVCPPDNLCTQHSMSRRSRPLISTPPDMNQRACPHLTESVLCECANKLSSNKIDDLYSDLNNELSLDSNLKGHTSSHSRYKNHDDTSFEFQDYDNDNSEIDYLDKNNNRLHGTYKSVNDEIRRLMNINILKNDNFNNKSNFVLNDNIIYNNNNNYYYNWIHSDSQINRKLSDNLGYYSTKKLLQHLYLRNRYNLEMEEHNDNLNTSDISYNSTNNKAGSKQEEYNFYNFFSSYLLGVNYTNFNSNITLDPHLFS
ncbi:hypothetical protein FG386_001879 [Cryptosporidium ryanae]|uniref:uncharacterized protein n=1 Tax=Cryptosporidium ryanae TaxID=515981 RepID=UPI003519F670|nr:hypothetical protein FG386_001879 [Cryptosporidium ryanae]